LQAQAAVVSRFRSGELNLLLATNIGSEGMDFKQCAAVVAFEPPPDVTSYIQVTVVQQALLVFDTGLW
jgi:endoribonuclease Dicer